MFDGYAALVAIVTPANIAPTITRDPADDQVLAAALAARETLEQGVNAQGAPS